MVPQPAQSVIRRSPFFGSLPGDVFEAICQGSSLHSISAGDILFNEGDVANSVCCVTSGLIKLSIPQRTGDDAIIEIFRPGESFAEALAFREDRYPASAVALVDSLVFVAPSKVVQQVIYANPEAFPAILAGTYRHLHKLVRQIEALKANSGLERLALYLLAATEREDDPVRIELPYEKQLLASLLGMKPETLSRLFRRLETHGVRMNGRIVEVNDRRSLQKLIDF